MVNAAGDETALVCVGDTPEITLMRGCGERPGLGEDVWVGIKKPEAGCKA
jgi:hypothetical protein